MKTTDIVDNQNKRTDLPDIRPGDEVKVHVRVVEGGKERVQIFQGNVVAITGRLHYSSWEDRDGVTRYGCEIIADKIDEGPAEDDDDEAAEA